MNIYRYYHLRRKKKAIEKLTVEMMLIVMNHFANGEYNTADYIFRLMQWKIMMIKVQPIPLPFWKRKYTTIAEINYGGILSKIDKKHNPIFHKLEKIFLIDWSDLHKYIKITPELPIDIYIDGRKIGEAILKYGSINLGGIKVL